MSKTIDNRVVEMEFDNRQFERGIRQTLASLDKLKKGLTLDEATKGLENVSAAGKNLNPSLDNIAGGVDRISSRFSALGAVGFTVIQNLTTAAMNYARKISGMVLDPLVAGGKRRAQNIEQAKFQFRGLGVDVEQAMDDALYAVLGTAYGLDEAARAASQLSASQVELGEDMKGALRGISGVAAMTNSSYEDTARIFTRVAGQGRLMAVDLNSIASRGLNAAATLGEAMGVSEAEIRDMVSKGMISFDMFATAMNDAFGENATKANETYSGSLSNLRAALSRIGANFYTQSLEDQRDLFNSITPAIDGVGDALQPVIDMMLEFSGGAIQKTIKALDSFNFKRLILITSPLVRTIENVVEAVGSILDPIREAFGQIFPPSSLLEIHNMLYAVEEFTETLKMGAVSASKLRRTFAGVFAIFSIAWTFIKQTASFLAELFSIATEGSGGILDVTASIGDFLVALDEAIKKGDGLTVFFSKLTDILAKPINFIKDLAAALFTIFTFEAPSVDEVSDALEPLGRLGEVLLDLWTRLGESVERVFGVFEPIVDAMLSFLGGVGDGIIEVFSDLDYDQILDTINTGFLGGLLVMVRRLATNLGNTIGSVAFNFTEPFRRLTFVMKTMQNTLRAMTLMQIAAAVAMLTGSLFALSKLEPEPLARALAGMSAIFAQLGLMMGALTLMGGFKGLTTTGVGIIFIAAAVRILVGAVESLSTLDWEDLGKGLAGLSGLLAGLTVVIKALSGSAGAMAAAGAGLLAISFGIQYLVDAVVELSGVSWGDLTKGLVAVGALLGSLTIFTRLSSVSKAGLAQGAGLLLLAGGIRILADAVSIFAGIDKGGIAKGLISIGLILSAFSTFSAGAGSPDRVLAASAALVITSGAMLIFAKAMGEIAELSWDEVSKGLTSIAGGLTIFAFAMAAMPPNVLASAASIAVVSASLILIGKAMKQMGKMSWEEIGKGLTVIAGALTIFAFAMTAMTTALPGAGATFVLAAALGALAPVLLIFAGMSFGAIAKSLGVLAGVFAIFAAAGLLLAPVAPVIALLGLGIALVGAGVAAAGAGLALFATGLTMVAAAGAAGTAAISDLVVTMAELLPLIGEQVGLALGQFANVVAESGPEILAAMSAVISSFTLAIQENAPDIIQTFVVLLTELLAAARELVPEMAATALAIMIGILTALNNNVPTIIQKMAALAVAMLEEMTDAVPDMARAGTELLVALLESIAENLGDVIDAGTDVVIAWIEGIGANAVRIAGAAMDTITDFVNGLADAIDRKSWALRSAGRKLAFAIVDGMTGGLASKVGSLVRSARDLASSAVEGAKRLLGVASPSKVFEWIGEMTGEGMAVGMTNTAKMVSDASASTGSGAVEAMRESISGMSDLLEMETDLNPTITPVLDLSDFNRGASEIAKSFGKQNVDVSMAYSGAKDASRRYQANRRSQDTTLIDEELGVRTEYVYNQYNTSPKALSAADIYRQTRNQLATARKEL